MQGLERLWEAEPAAEEPRPRLAVLSLVKEHVTMLAVGVLVIIVATFMWANRVESVAIEVTAAPTPSPSPPEPSPIVHVIGAVQKPGIVTVAPSARVADAIQAAGGLTGKAEPGELNLAAPVVDGSQIRVGSKEKPGGEIRGVGVPDSGTGGTGKINLNQATVEQLDKLPGVGPVTANAIVTWREKNKRFTKVEQLQEVDGIGPKTFSQLKDLVSV